MLLKKRHILLARSSNGRTTASGAVYLGSNPSLAAYANKGESERVLLCFCIPVHARIRREGAAKPEVNEVNLGSDRRGRANEIAVTPPLARGGGNENP